jgi:hypothetical protein
LFGEDNWRASCSIKLLAPNLWVSVSPRVRRSRIVQEDLSTGPRGIRWVADITHARTVQVIVQFLSIWDLVQAVRLSSEPDKFIWKWSPNGQYSSSAYAALFLGRVDILGARQIWNTLMPGKCKFFAWLVLHDRCWTSDRLHRHGLKDSDTCALCAQEVETLDHLLVDCAFSQETWLFEPSSIFFYLSLPRTIPCLLLLGGAPPGSWPLKPDEKILLPLSGWSLGRFGGSTIGTFTTRSTNVGGSRAGNPR